MVGLSFLRQPPVMPPLRCLGLGIAFKNVTKYNQSMATSRNEHVIRDLRQLRALTSPIRSQIVHALQAVGRASAKELAAQLGRLPESLYYHLRKLVSVGLVVEVEQRPSARRPEAVYALVSPHLSIDAEKRTKAWLEQTARLARLRLRAIERDYVAGLQRPELERRGSAPQLHARQARVRLTKGGLRKVKKLVDELNSVLQQENARGHGEFYTWMTILAPAARSVEDA